MERWFDELKCGSLSLEDDSNEGRSNRVKTPEIIAEIQNRVLKDRQKSAIKVLVSVFEMQNGCCL